MAYDKKLAERIREALAGTPFREVNMFGGLSFLVNEKLAVSATTQGDLMIRCDPEQVDVLVSKEGAQWAEMRGRKMKRDGCGLTREEHKTSKALPFGSLLPCSTTRR